MVVGIVVKERYDFIDVDMLGFEFEQRQFLVENFINICVFIQ